MDKVGVAENGIADEANAGNCGAKISKGNILKYLFQLAFLCRVQEFLLKDKIPT